MKAFSKTAMTHHEADVTVRTVQQALQILQREVLPKLMGNPSLRSWSQRLQTLYSHLQFALNETYQGDFQSEDDLYKGEHGNYLTKLVQTVSKLRQALQAGSIPPIPENAIQEIEQDVQHIYAASVKHKCASKRGALHRAMEQEDFVMNTPKLLGKPGVDPDVTNFFDNRELFRKFYSQFYEGAVMIADDGTYYQVLQLVIVSGNFVAMMQDVLHPQIVFTISVTDLVAHCWKWISPYDVVVNPELAPKTVQSVSDIVSVQDLEKPEVPKEWLSY